MPTSILIESKTAAETKDFTVSPEHVPATLSCIGLSGSETIPLTLHCAGSFVAPADATLSASQKVITINGPGRWRLVKGVTASAAAVQLDF